MLTIFRKKQKKNHIVNIMPSQADSWTEGRTNALTFYWKEEIHITLQKSEK